MVATVTGAAEAALMTAVTAAMLGVAVFAMVAAVDRPGSTGHVVWHKDSTALSGGVSTLVNGQPRREPGI